MTKVAHKSYTLPCIHTDSLLACVLQDEDMASPIAHQGYDTSGLASGSGVASSSAFKPASENQGMLSKGMQQQNFQNCMPLDGKPCPSGTSEGQIKASSKPEAGKRGQSQYAQFLHRSSIETPKDEEGDAQPLLRRSSSLGAASNREPADPSWKAQKLERQPSRVHFVAAHQSADGDSDSADHVQEAASHREQMSGSIRGQAGDGGCQTHQPQPKFFDRQLTFQEMLHQQIQVSLPTLAVMAFANLRRCHRSIAMV